jgi:hypothetical protein
VYTWHFEGGLEVLIRVHVVVRWVPTGLCVFWVCVYIGMDTSLLVRIISQSPSSIVEHLFVFSCDSIEDFFYFGSKT